MQSYKIKSNEYFKAKRLPQILESHTILRNEKVQCKHLGA